MFSLWLEQTYDLIKDITNFWTISTEWQECIIVPLYNGKGITLEREKCWGLKLLDQLM